MPPTAMAPTKIGRQGEPGQAIPQQVGQGADDDDGDQVVDAEHRMGEAVEEATAAGEVGEVSLPRT